MAVGDHFRRRVAERIGPHVSADALWFGFLSALNEGSDHVEFATRAVGGNPVYRLHLTEDRTVYMVVARDFSRPYTIYLPGWYISRSPKKKMRKLR